MTKVMMRADKEKGSIFFDCMNHAGDREVCIMCSTLCNVLGAAVTRASTGDIISTDGHVQFNIEKRNYALLEVFEAVMDTFKEVEKEHPDKVKIY